MKKVTIAAFALSAVNPGRGRYSGVRDRSVQCEAQGKASL
jgi:hypothetical protein